MADVTAEMLERATAAVVAAHDDELRAYLAGEIEANVWRPERYAEAALRAALNPAAFSGEQNS
jgi:hypothetical protein